MIVKSRGLAPEKSTYALTSRSKELSYDLAIAQLLQGGQSITEAQTRLAHVFATQPEPDAEQVDDVMEQALRLVARRPPIEVVLSDIAVRELSKGIKSYFDKGGSQSWFVKTSDEAEVYYLVESLSRGLLGTISDGEKSAQARVSQALSRLHQGDKLWSVRVHLEDGTLSDPMTRGDFARELAQGQSEEVYQAVLELVRANFDEKKLGQWRIQVPSVDDFDPELSRGLDSFGRRLMTDARMQLPSMPAVISNSPTVPCFTYVPSAKFVSMDTPNFDAWLEVVHPDCRAVFMASIFAPFHSECRHRKLVWLHSQGYDGKSTFFNALNRWSGGQLVGAFSNANLGEFGQESLIGKRILLWADAQNLNALGSNLVHNITGGDTVLINRKNQKHIQYRYNCMLFVAANAPPEIKTWQRNEMTRMIYVRFEAPTEEQLKRYCRLDDRGRVMRYPDGEPMFKGSNLEDQLVEEMPGILFKCKEQYLRLCHSPYQDIVVPEPARRLMLQHCGHTEADKFSAFIEAELEFDPSYTEDAATISIKAKRSPLLQGIRNLETELARLLTVRGCGFGQKPSGLGRIYRGVRLKP